MAKLSETGHLVLAQHQKDYNEILLHILASELVSEPLIELATVSVDKNAEKINKYCRFIEEMWKTGDEDVVNVVEVTILEHLSDDEFVWHLFGSCISEEFREYINTEVLTSNTMMAGVKLLRG